MASDLGQQLIAQTRLVRAEKKIERAVNKALAIHKAKAFEALNTQTLVAAAPPDAFDEATWNQTVEEQVQPVIDETLATFAVGTIAALGLGAAITEAASEAIDTAEYAGIVATAAVALGTKTASKLTQELSQGASENESKEALATRIRNVFESSTKESALLARNEVNNAAEGSKLAAVSYVMGLDIRIVKRWLSTLDTKVRKTHKKAHGQERKVSDDFHVGLAYGPRPKAMGLPDEDCGCRCNTFYRVLKDNESYPKAD